MSGPIFNLAKRSLSLLPATWPSRIYNVCIKAPLLKKVVSKAVQKLVPEYIDIPEGRVIFDKEDPVISGGLTLGKYEPVATDFLRSHIKTGMTVLDIGANLGYFTVIAAGRVGTTGRVISYEPDPHNFALLQRNISSNGFDSVTAVQAAASDAVGTRELFFGDNQCTLSFDDKRGRGRSETVRTETVDSSLRSLGINRVDLIKMDIEGAEPIALEGMTETIAANPDLIMLFEFYPNAIKRLERSPISFLEKILSFGFSLYQIDEDGGTIISIKDTKAFVDSYEGKELSQNLVALRVL